MMSKLPYINRLFKNVGIGRETQSLMLMVTPRIIIQEEEEQKLGIELLFLPSCSPCQSVKQLPDAAGSR